MDKTNNPYVKKTKDGSVRITRVGKSHLKKIVTDVDGPVYAFYGNSSPLMAAAAMARLSRRGSDLREIYLDEFAATGDNDAANLIQRVVTAYGDDSVQQLVGVHIVVEDASNYLTKLLEWGRFAAYLEQSTRYIYFDQKDKNGKYKYLIPQNLDKKITAQYVKTHDQIFDLYSELVHELTDFVRNNSVEPETKREKVAWMGATKAQACDAIRPILPVSTKSTVGIFGSSQAIESLVLHLLAEPLLEAKQAGDQILTEARKVIPAFLERTDRPDRGGALTAYRANTKESVKKSAGFLPKKSSAKKYNVELLDYWPKNDLDIVPHLLFSDSNLATTEIMAAAKKLTVKQKEKILSIYMGERLNRRHRPARAMEIPHYMWEVTADYGTFRDLQRHRVVDAFEWQKLTIDYGYEIPELVTEAGLDSKYKQCFDLSEKLYGLMIKTGYLEEAQYSTLFGHRMRYKFMLNARAAFHFIELRSTPQGHPGYRKIATRMHELIIKAHPHIASAMRFVNKDEDPELTRMAAELATQYKLEKLDKQSK